jgi:hypothetical protein
MAPAEPTPIEAAQVVEVDRNAIEGADHVGAALALAMQGWCNGRDPWMLRRALLKLLAELEA